MNRYTKIAVLVSALMPLLANAQTIMGPQVPQTPMVTDSYTIAANDGNHTVTEPIDQFTKQGLQFQQEYNQARAQANAIRIDVYDQPELHDNGMIADLFTNPGINDAINDRHITIRQHLGEHVGGLQSYPAIVVTQNGVTLQTIYGIPSVDGFVTTLNNIPSDVTSRG